MQAERRCRWKNGLHTRRRVATRDSDDLDHRTRRRGKDAAHVEALLGDLPVPPARGTVTRTRSSPTGRSAFVGVRRQRPLEPLLVLLGIWRTGEM